MFKGSWVALVTPFRNGRLDELALKALVEFHIENQTDGIVPCGTTGESATLSHAEHKRVLEIVVKTARGRIPVMAGAGSNATAESLELVRHAAKVGAQAALLVVPYYNKPTPRGLYEHFKTIADATRIPIILYNIPSRTGINMPVETVVKLARDCPTIIGIKEASGTIDYSSQLLAAVGPDRLSVLSGDDSLTLPLMAVGARGVISVVANILPRATAELCRSVEIGDLERARELHLQLIPVIRALFSETNPIPVKTAMKARGYCSDELRLPLVSMSPVNKRVLLAALKACPLFARRHD